MATAAIMSMPALGCDCAEKYLNTTNGKAKATAVFSGEPTAKEGHFGNMLYTFRVEAMWKGALLKQSFVHGGVDSCGYAFRTGITYLVFTQSGHGTRDDPAMTSICSSNKELSSAGTDVRLLGKPFKVYEKVERKTPPVRVAGSAATRPAPAPAGQVSQPKAVPVGPPPRATPAAPPQPPPKSAAKSAPGARVPAVVQSNSVMAPTPAL